LNRDTKEEGMGRLIDILATLVCLGAGGYLLLSQTQAGNSYLEVLGHGIGAYFVGKGLFIARSTHLEAEAATLLSRLAEFAALRNDRDTALREDYSGLPPE
jgi:hypothetical protein